MPYPFFCGKQIPWSCFLTLPSLFLLAVDPCCYFPCQHSGLCVRVGTEGYECDCTRTGYYGTNCSSPRATLIPSPPTFSGNYGYLNWESYSNLSYFTRILPPVPPNCPTPMGLKGPPELPGAELVAEELLLRRTFHPDPQRTNLMFAFFAQHFTHQFFKTYGKMGRGFTRALGHGVDLGHIYGDNLERQHQLRLFKDGKLKYQGIPPEQRFAMGQEVFGLLPGLLMYATLWLREHNRVCDLLKNEHPTWDDEQLFQTARLILTGETIKIVIEDYVQHLSGYHLKLMFEPDLLFGSQFQYQNRIALEFNQLYHWHALMPDSFQLPDREYTYDQFLFNNTILTQYSIETLPNINKNLLKVAIGTIKESRLMRFQPFNEYRKRFHLKPYTSFWELTDDEDMVATLEELYGDIDALEFFPGLLVEKTYPDSIFGQSMIEMGAPFSLKGLLGNPICSPEYWKPSTFGGAIGFQIVNTASLQKL
ncbi:Prostaglandin G/H synthase 1, partial [Ophiophagus hannah]